MFWRKLVPICSNLFSVLFPVNMPLWASMRPVLATNGMFIGLMSICRGPWLFYLYLLLVVGCIILVCNMLCLYVQCVASICVASLRAMCSHGYVQCVECNLSRRYVQYAAWLRAMCRVAACNCATWLRAMCRVAACNCAAWLRAMCCTCIVCNVLGGV